MKNFLKAVLANIVAYFIIIFIFFGFFIFIIVASAASTGKDTKIKENSVLTISFKHKIIDYDTESEISIFSLKNNEELRYHDIVQAIKAAQNDNRIKGISIETDDIEAGNTQIDDIRKSIEDFKKSGKFVYAYGNIVSQGAYYLGSVADQYFLNPAGNIELKGIASEVVFLKDFAEKYGININVIRHGKFKAAVEPFLRNDLSAENKEQISTLINDVWSDTSAKMMQSRKLGAEEFKTIVDSLYSVIPELSLKHKLVDRLVQKSEYENIIKEKLNVPASEDFNKVSIAQYIHAQHNVEPSNDKIAVLYASGTIYNGNSLNDIHSERYISYIKELTEDDNIKAVVLRINSPGGSANASDEILFELQQLRQKKPLIISFGDYAASGGYYIAMAGEKIFAQNNTITGSIGVFSVFPDFKPLANKNGIHTEIVTTNANSNMMSPMAGVSAGTIDIMQKSVEQTYKRFVYFVSENRKKSAEEINAIGEGRVWSGKKAKEIGLVDEIGTLDDAIKYAASRAKLTDYQTENYPAKIDKLHMLFSSIEEENIAARYIKKEMDSDSYQFYQLLTNPKLKNSVQMIMPYSISIK